MPRGRRPRLDGRAPAASCAAATIVLALSLAACGGEEDPATEAQDVTAEGAEITTETTAQPPPEVAPGNSSEVEATNSGRRSEGGLADQAATGPQPCPDVVITPNSGDGLFSVEAEGITCEDAAAALEAWGVSGYPGDGPPGFSCEEVSQNESGSVRLRCEQDASGAVVEFDTGN